MTDKQTLRQELLRKRRAVPQSVRDTRDAAILRQLAELSPAACVFCYVGTDFEIATLPYLAARLENGLPVCVPLCERGGIMTARAIASLSELTAGAYGLPEPPRDAAVVEMPALAVIPALAFDRSGYRMGRGGGYYDRWLSAHPGVETVGLCYNAFLYPCLPSQAHDLPVRRVITETGIHETEGFLCS
ncbi:MAG: 5-formyltetrahydrofolate cyclo-ligase [Clostridiales bacterium]|nr:5-formyltetrahydrofolate cyclo-ligase [Clostridiales bacterium]